MAHILDSSDEPHCYSPWVTRLAVPLTLAACAVLTAACSSSLAVPTASSRATTTTTPPTTVPDEVPSTTAPPFYEVTTTSVAGLGTVLVNGEGFTLYMFEPDRLSGKSACYCECENLWPPVLLVDGIKAPVAGAGVNASLLGTTVRAGDLEQISYNGWPSTFGTAIRGPVKPRDRDSTTQGGCGTCWTPRGFQSPLRHNHGIPDR